MKILKALSLAMLVAAGVAVGAGVVLASWTHVIDEDDSYITSSGSFSSDSNCGLRGDCQYGLNVSSGATRSKYYSFWDQYSVVDGAYQAHLWNPSDAYAFVPSEHATTFNAKYKNQSYVYDPVLCPNLCTYERTDTVSQYNYSDEWVPLTTNLQVNWVSLNNDTGETTGWYTVGWEAAKVEY